MSVTVRLATPAVHRPQVSMPPYLSHIAALQQLRVEVGTIVGSSSLL
jgi:hypothetical protein